MAQVAAVAWVSSLAQELPHATGMPKKKKKKGDYHWGLIGLGADVFGDISGSSNSQCKSQHIVLIGTMCLLPFVS